MSKNGICRSVTAVIYQKIARPLLFKISPDAVHTKTVKLGMLVQPSRLIRRLINICWAYPSTPALRQRLNGIDFYNPVGLSAGFDKNIEVVPLMKAIGFGFMEGGTVTNQSSGGNSRPWFHRLPKSKSLVVHAGLANQGVKVVAERISGYKADTFDKFTLNMSIAHSNVASIKTEKSAIIDCAKGVAVAAKLKSVGMITVNVSCPNTYDGNPFTNPETLEKLLKEIDKVDARQPIFLKMPVHLDWKAFDAMVSVIARHKVSGLTIANLAKDREAIKNNGDNLPDAIKGGFSGGPTRQLSNDLIFRTRTKYKDRFTIIGVGGIFSADDAYVKIRAGANLVALITGIIYEGPQIVGQINQGLDRLLKRDGFASIYDAVGADIE